MHPGVVAVDKRRNDHWWNCWGNSETWPVWVLGLLLAGIVLAAYSNTLGHGWLFDDYHDVLDNASIRNLWPLWKVFYVKGQGFLTRPVVNLSFALNVALGGMRPFGFHVLNTVIHVACALIIFGVARRSFLLPSLRVRYGEWAAGIALVVSVIWALHPLQTQAVAYITQRYESLAALFVMGTFYCFLRGCSGKWGAWDVCSVLCCLLALGSKEIAVSLPVLILLFDWVLVSGSFSGALRSRWRLYIGYGFAWICFIVVQANAVPRVFAGAETGTPWWQYALNQPSVILHYLWQAFWPRALVFDYFWRISTHVRVLLPGLVVIGFLLGGSIYLLMRRKPLGLLGTAFFMILAPTSSLLPINDPAVEHRMYLPLLLVVLVVVVIVFEGWRLFGFQSTRYRLATASLIGVMLGSLGVSTFLRNDLYRDSLDIWQDTVAKVPKNPRAHHNLAYNLAERGLLRQAVREYEISIALAPQMPLFQSNYGVVLARLERYEESLNHLKLARSMEPDNFRHLVNLGGTYLLMGQLDNAQTSYREAIRMDPKAAVPYAALASVEAVRGDLAAARQHLEEAVRLDPYNRRFRIGLVDVFLKQKDAASAQVSADALIRIERGVPDAFSELAWLYHGHGHDRRAVELLKQALQKDSIHLGARMRLAWILSTSPEDEVRNGGEAMNVVVPLLSDPTQTPPEVMDLLAAALAENGKFAEATVLVKDALLRSEGRAEKWKKDLAARGELYAAGKPYRSSKH